MQRLALCQDFLADKYKAFFALLNILARLNDQLLKLMPLQPEAKLPALLAMADIHLLPQKAEAADLVVKGMGGAISARTVTYDFERLMEGATLVTCSEFGECIIKHMD